MTNVYLNNLSERALTYFFFLFFKGDYNATIPQEKIWRV